MTHTLPCDMRYATEQDGDQCIITITCIKATKTAYGDWSYSFTYGTFYPEYGEAGEVIHDVPMGQMDREILRHLAAYTDSIRLATRIEAYLKRMGY